MLEQSHVAAPDRNVTGVIRSICASFQIEILKTQIEYIEKAREQSGVIDIVVLGQFKAGKSSFLNRLIGWDLLPVDVLPATAVVTRISYASSEAMTVHRKSGETEKVSHARIAEFVTERLNPGNEKQVSIVDIQVPSLKAFKGIRFVDTPGLGSVFSHNTRVSMDWFPKVGAGLVAISVNHPFSEQDLKLLREVSPHTPEIAILLTKADLVSDSQLDAIVEFTQRQIIQRLGWEARVLPFSVLAHYEEMRKGVCKYILQEISLRHEEKYEEIIAYKTLSLIQSCREYLHVAERAALVSEKAKLDLTEAIVREKADIGSVNREIRIFTLDLKSRIRTDMGERFGVFAAETSRRLRGTLGSRLQLFRGNLSETAHAFREWTIYALEEELTALSAHGEERLSAHLFRAQKMVHRVVRAFQDRLAKEIERALGLTFSGAHFNASIRKPARPNIKVGYVFDIHIDQLWFLIPMQVFRRPIHRHLLRRVPWEVEKNISRLAGQWADAASESIDDLVGQATRFIEEEILTVERMVSGTVNRCPEIMRAFDELSAVERKISD